MVWKAEMLIFSKTHNLKGGVHRIGQSEPKKFGQIGGAGEVASPAGSK